MKHYYEHFVAASYDFWARHRWVLIGLTALTLCTAVLITVKTPVGNDISSMLPDKDPHFRKDFELFSYAPFSKNVLISLEDPNDQQGSAERLMAAADKIVVSLKGRYFTDVMSGINQEQKLRLFNWMYDHLPCLFTEQDIKNLEGKLGQAAVAGQLQDNIKVLSSPESVVLKEMILKDPLAIRTLLLGKLKQLSVVRGFSADSDYFISTDNKRILLIAETPIAMTDYAGGRKMLDNLYGTLKASIPAGMKYRVICGHRYTVANAETIQKDLWRVFFVSIGGLFVVYMVFLRTWRVLVVFLVSSTAFLIGAAFVGGVFGRISGITLGFGTVLLGIADDYGLHVFYSFQEEGVDGRSVVAEFTRPLIYGASMTIGVFAVMLISSLPGERELAIFSVVGIAAALLVAIFVLPHIVYKKPLVPLFQVSMPRRHPWVRVFWIIVILACLIPASRVQFDGNIKNVGMTPADILGDEIEIKNVWGGIREHAIAFATGTTLQAAMEKNDLALAHMQSKMPAIPFVSMGTIIPSIKIQHENLARWNRFWNDSGRKAHLAATLETEGGKYGFNRLAFEPFLLSLERPAREFTLEDFRNSCNDKIVSPFITTLKNGDAAVLSFMPDDEGVTQSVLSSDVGLKIISNRQFSKNLNHETAKDFVRFFCGAAITTFILLFLLFRDFKRPVLVLMPAMAGLVIMFAIMTLFGMKLNLFNIAAACLVIGLGVDYGIFVICTYDRPTGKHVRHAVLVSGLTTVMGFGSLMVARHPALNSIGATVTAGVIPAILCALTLLPSLGDSWLREKSKL